MKDTAMQEIMQPITPAEIDEARFFESVLLAAANKGLITPQRLTVLQAELALLLQNRLILYTHGESSSVRTETAAKLGASVCYTLGARLAEYPSLDDTVSALKSINLSALFSEGRHSVRQTVARANELLKQAVVTRIPTENLAYNQTLDEALPGLFADYEPEFAAHDIPCLIDYPLCGGEIKRVGAGYIAQYLTRLLGENELCGRFAPDEVLLIQRCYHPDCDNLLVNLCELVLANAFGRVLLGKTPDSLMLTARDIAGLIRLLSTLSPAQYAQRIEVAMGMLSRVFDVQPACQGTLFDALATIRTRLDGAVSGRSRDFPFVALDHDTVEPSVLFTDAPRMTDEAFRDVVGELTACRYFEDKLTIITQRIHSFTDLVDLLGAGCLFDAEFTDLFGTLGNAELALLYQTAKADGADDLHRSAAQQDWQRAFFDYWNTLTPARRDEIDALQIRL